jgi:EAL domain-containing protein (putative c-di-GMP-specific phosphodiesterase class I)
VREIIGRQTIRTVFQPIVDLSTEAVLGYEALSRGPAGCALESPAALFGAASEAGLTIELDWVCRGLALRAALAAHVHRTRAIFINVEPTSLSRPTPEWLSDLTDIARSRLTTVLEITERATADAPAVLLAATERMRERGALLAIDDVGTDPASLALLPFLHPEVIKLDMDVTQTSRLSAMARTATAVNAYAERSGALVLAEGIETREHRETALALGADLGQGWLFGRPGPLPADAVLPPLRSLLANRRTDSEGAGTPFELLSAVRPVRRGTKGLLLRMSRGIEEQARTEGDSVVLLSTFQEASFFTDATRRRYRQLAKTSALVGALGVGLPNAPEPGVRGASLRPSEPLRGEWDVCLVGPYIAAAFAGRDLGDAGPDLERRFDFVITHDRDHVITATRALMRRLSADAAAPNESAETVPARLPPR